MKCESITLAFGSGSGVARGVQWFTQIAIEEQCTKRAGGGGGRLALGLQSKQRVRIQYALMDGTYFE